MSSSPPPVGPSSDGDWDPAPEPDVQEAPKKKKSKVVEYPADIPRLLRKGKSTFAIGTGPLPDDTDWSSISYAVLKEECTKRDISASGTVADLRAALTEYKEPDLFTPGMDMSDITGKGKSATGEKRKKNWEDIPSHVYARNVAKSNSETICVIGMRDNSGSQKFAGPSIEFRVVSDRLNASPYHVTISRVPKCDCPSQMYRPQEMCKHTFYVLMNVLKVPEPLRWQMAFLSDELGNFFAPIFKASPDDSALNCNVGELVSGDCPICFHHLNDPETEVQCLSCHAKMHKRCFNTWALHTDGYGPLKCVACHQDWNQPGNWGSQAMHAEDEAAKIAKIEAKEQAKAAKAAEKAAEKEAKASARAAATEARAAVKAAAKAVKEAEKERKKREKLERESDNDNDDGDEEDDEDDADV